MKLFAPIRRKIISCLRTAIERDPVRARRWQVVTARFYGFVILGCAALLFLGLAAQVQAQGIGFDNATGASGQTNILTFSHTVSGTDRLLIVGVSIVSAETTVSSVTYAGSSLGVVGVRSNPGLARIEIWRLVAPATGANNVVVNLGTSKDLVAGAASFTGVNQTTPLGTFFSAIGSSSPATVNVTGVAEGEVVIDTLNPLPTTTPTVGAGQTQRWNTTGGTTGAGSTKPGPAGAGTVTMSWTFSPSDSWAIGAVAIKPKNATAVRLSSFSANSHEGGVHLSWKTGYEVDNLGFHVYREQAGERVRLTPELVAGSALLAGSGTPLTSGQSYTWWDPLETSGQQSEISGQRSDVSSRSSTFNPQSSSLVPQPSSLSPVKYWLEDIDLNGTRTWHGPVTPVLSREALPKILKPELLSELSRRLNQKYDDFWRAQDLKEKLRQSSPITQAGSARVIKSASSASGQQPIKQSGVQRVQAVAPALTTQLNIASKPAVKILVKENGWYRVTRSELIAAGLSPSANPGKLQLYREGVEQPIAVLSQKSGKTTTLSAIEFYGEGLDTVSTDTRTYWLVQGSRPGKRIGVALSPQISILSPPNSFPFTVERKDRVFYFAALKNGEAESFFGPLVTTEPVDQLLTVAHQDPSPPAEPVLELALQGLTNTAHQVKVLFNEVEIGEVDFDGQSLGETSWSIPQSYLLAGDNVVSLVSQGGETDVSLIDTVRLTYWHTYTADSDSLRFSAQGGEQLTIDGFSQTPIQVVDITDPNAVMEVAGLIQVNDTGYGITVQVPGQGVRTLIAFTANLAMPPVSVEANQPSKWHQKTAGADLVIIAHRDFLAQLAPLKALRQGQKLSVALIDVEDLYDEFNFGAKSPQAIKDFLALTRNNWQRPPRFVLLVGDASVDPKNYLGFGDFDRVPTKLVETMYLKTASDDWFVDFNSDGLPDIAVGRLPVRTAEEAATVISKIINYEQGAASAVHKALLVADRNDGFDFEGASEQVEGLLPAALGVEKIYRGSFASDEEAKNALIGSLNQGSSLVNYVGHGSVEILRGLFSSDEALALSNGTGLPFFVSMTCLNGFFHDVYTESLAEALLKAPQGGAMAVWASSALTEPGEQAVMDRELIRLLFNNSQPLALGEAAAQAKAAITDPDIRRSWIFFGDPTTRLR
jgi:hypothetical protein